LNPRHADFQSVFGVTSQPRGARTDRGLRRHTPALCRPDACEVRCPLEVRLSCFKPSIENVRRNRMFDASSQIKRQPAPSGTRFQPRNTHQTLDPVNTAAMTPVPQISSHSPCAVSPIALGKTRGDRRGQLHIDPRSFALWTFSPGVKSATGHLKGLAQPGQGGQICWHFAIAANLTLGP
jgi:hypothetical protein